MAHTTRELLAQHFSRAAPPRGWFDAMAADKPPPRMYRPTASMELEYLALDEKSGAFCHRSIEAASEGDYSKMKGLAYGIGVSSTSPFISHQALFRVERLVHRARRYTVSRTTPSTR